MHYSMHRFSCLFIYLFPIQICTAARNGSKRSVPTDEALGFVLTVSACDYLLCGRLKRNSLFRGPRCHFDSTCHQTLAKVFTDFGCLERLQATEGGPGHVLMEMACDDLPCGRGLLCILGGGDLEAILLHAIGCGLSGASNN